MRYSFSKLTSFYECPYAFYRYYQLKEEGEDNMFARYGILVHSILERYAMGALTLDQLVEEFKTSFELEINEPIIMFGKDLTNGYYDKGLAFFTEFKGFWGLTPLEAEYQFETDLGNDSFVGVVDLIAKNQDGKLVIVDHKSSAKFTKKKLKEKQRQLYLYAKAIYDKYGEFPEEVWFNHFKDGYIEKIKFKQEDYDEAISWALETIKKIDVCMEFEPNNSEQFYCNYLCDYRNSCEFK